MNRQRIRDQLDITLGEPVPDSLWDLLVDSGHVEDVQVGAADISVLADKVKSVRGSTGRKPAPKMLPKKEAYEAQEDGEDLATLRDTVISIFLATQAFDEPEVQKFREEALHGVGVDLDDIETWIDGQRKIDIETWVKEMREKIDIENLSPEERLKYVQEAETGLIEYTTPGYPWVKVRGIPPGGVLARLLNLSISLTRKYPWKIAQATTYVLTGALPMVRRIDYQIHSPPLEVGTRITLTIDPTTTPQEVADYYQSIRKDMLPKRYRSLSEKHLRLARFVALCGVEWKKWGEGMRAWNAAYPDYRYDNESNFIRDARQAKQRLLSPGYKWPS
jgi:hypothetical protein